MSTDDRRLDGNAIAGELAGIFGRDITTALAVCGGCGRASSVGALYVYVSGPGTVARCPGCGAALLRLARAGERVTLAASALRRLDILPSSA